MKSHTAKKILKTKFNKPLKMTPGDENDFQTATSCHICGKQYIESDVKVRDHCHVTGKYRGSAHESCNLNFQLTDKIPVIFHNLKGYDSHFIMQMNHEHITDEEHNHAQTVWNTFELKTMGEYHDLYLQSDVLLLADVFENFRKTCLEYYRLDPCHYFTSPGLRWNAMLKMTDVKLELITDINLLKKECVVVSVISPIDMEKQTINICKIGIQMKPVNISCIWMQITYMVGQ